MISTAFMESFRHFHEPVAGLESSESIDTCFRSLGSQDGPLNEMPAFL